MILDQTKKMIKLMKLTVLKIYSLILFVIQCLYFILYYEYINATVDIDAIIFSNLQILELIFTSIFLDILLLLFLKSIRIIMYIEIVIAIIITFIIVKYLI